MSYPALCVGCAVGEHAKHVQRENYPEQLIGGTHCPCEGDCKPPDLMQALKDSLARLSDTEETDQ